MIELTIYVPKPGTFMAHTIHPGSGIVGSPHPVIGAREGAAVDEDRIKIDYEGAIHNQRMTWEGKVFHAAGRHVASYPTVARSWPLAADLIAVGTFRCEDNWKNKEFIITDQAALDEWRR